MVLFRGVHGTWLIDNSVRVDAMEKSISGKTVELYFVDGDPNGIITAEVFNWTGHVLMTSSASTQIKRVLERDEAKRTGIYILLGEIEGDETVYIGEAEGIKTRLSNHMREKDWWEKAILVTTTTNNLNKAHVKYLEARLIKIADEARNVSLDNKKNSSIPNLSEPDIANMEEFLNNLLMVLPALRVEVFVKNKPKQLTKQENDTIFELQNAKMIIKGSYFIVLAGSQVSGGWEGKDFGGDRKKIDDLKKTGIIKPYNDKFMFAEDYAFPSASKAAKIVVGRNANGRTEWKIKGSGKTLKDWEKEQLEDEKTEG